MKNKLCIAIVLLLAATAMAQQPATVTAQQYIFPLVDPPLQVASANVRRVGNPGSQAFYYWIVTHAIAGNSAPAGPYFIDSVANTLDGSNFVTINWAKASNATVYDVLRTTTPAMPVGACACAVTLATPSLTTNDQSISLSAYTVSTFAPASLAITFQNESNSSSSSRIVARNPAGGILYTLPPAPSSQYAKKTCQISFGSDDGSALTTANIQPQRSLCEIEDAATLQQIVWMVDAGATTIQIGYRNAGATTNIIPVLTPTAQGTITDNVACANSGGTAITIDGVAVTCSALSVTALPGSVHLWTTGGAADGTSKRGIAFIVYIPN